MSNIDKRAYSVSQIIADLKLKHGSGDTYAPIMRWDELLALLDELEAKGKRNERALSLLKDASPENVWEIIGRLKVVISGDYRSEAEIAAAAGKGEAS